MDRAAAGGEGRVYYLAAVRHSHGRITMDIQRLASLILRAQHLYETSWNKHMDKYMWSQEDAATTTCIEDKVEEDGWDIVICILISRAAQDITEWASVIDAENKLENNLRRGEDDVPLKIR